MTERSRVRNLLWRGWSQLSNGALGGSSQSGISGKEVANRTGPFSDILGEDPWAELSTPITPVELRGASDQVQTDVRYRLADLSAHDEFR
jgi:hypothetical protein